MIQLQFPPVIVAEHSMSPEYLHDLLTPLNHIIGFSEILIEQAQEEGQPGFIPDLEKILAAAQQLLTLLNTGCTTPPE